jgi:mRNA-degrading endonuclease toxin of MazEF toxin-antitoxin module
MLVRPEGQVTGLAQTSVATCLHLVTMTEDRIGKVIGKHSAGLMQKIDECLKAALGLP